MSGKSFLILVLSVCWILLCQRWYCCWMHTACANCTDEPINEHAVAFLPDSIDPDTTALWNSLIDDLIKNRPTDHKLEVSGKYFAREKGTPSVGISRAKNVAKLLESSFPNTPIAYRSQALHLSKENHEGYLPLIDLQWIPNKHTKPQGLVIYYDVKSTSPTIDQTSEKRLEEIVGYALKHNKKVKIDGYSSPSGSERVNVKLSKERAINMSKVLEKKGIPVMQIIVEGHGSEQPIFSDNPEKNKRVEISIIN